MQPADLRGKRVLVMGLGLHGGGLGVTRWLLRQGARVTVTDLKTREQLGSTLDQLEGEPVEFVLGEHREADFASANLIVRNPGVPRESPWLEVARSHGVRVEMEMGLFFAALPAGAAQVIGITGTKGKTTTTLMVGEILERHDPRTVVAGNLRISALELLDRIDARTPVVLELSSWQLEGLAPHRVSPRYAAITNIYPDHLNRYRDLEDYAEAKSLIFTNQQPGDTVVLNFDSPVLTRLRRRAFSHVIWFSAKRALTEGAFLDGDNLVWAWQGQRKTVLRTSHLQIPGRHNAENALAATALTAAWGVPLATIREALLDFRGAPHRLELVGELNGVKFINDTTATAPAAAIAALDAIASSARRIVLIAGGADKGLDYRELAQSIRKHSAEVILLEGSATEKLMAALESAGASQLIRGRWDDLAKGVEQAASLAQSGDIVLLSPGAASFGMFANEFERGDRFRELVAGRQEETSRERGS